MKIELIIKTAKLKEFSEEEKEDRRNKRIIGSLDDEETAENMLGIPNKLPIEFAYKPHVVESDDICSFTPFDKDHTIVSTYNNGDMLVKMGWENWKNTYEYVSGENIKIIEILPKKTVTRIKN